MQTLPKCLLFKIFRKITLWYRPILRLVCKQWNALIQERRVNLTHLTYYDTSILEYLQRHNLADFTNPSYIKTLLFSKGDRGKAIEYLFSFQPVLTKEHTALALSLDLQVAKFLVEKGYELPNKIIIRYRDCDPELIKYAESLNIGVNYIITALPDEKIYHLNVDHNKFAHRDLFFRSVSRGNLDLVTYFTPFKFNVHIQVQALKLAQRHNRESVLEYFKSIGLGIPSDYPKFSVNIEDPYISPRVRNRLIFVRDTYIFLPHRKTFLYNYVFSRFSAELAEILYSHGYILKDSKFQNFLDTRYNKSAQLNDICNMLSWCISHNMRPNTWLILNLDNPLVLDHCHSLNITFNDDPTDDSEDDDSEYADRAYSIVIRHGSRRSLDWLYQHDYKFKRNRGLLRDLIFHGSLQMLDWFLDKGLAQNIDHDIVFDVWTRNPNHLMLLKLAQHFKLKISSTEGLHEKNREFLSKIDL